MCIDEITGLCRLCFSTTDLLWIFSDDYAKRGLKNIIFVTTSVEILRQDLISQKVCKKCIDEVLKINKFRKNAVEKDKILKMKYKELTKNGELKIPNTNIIIKSGASTQKAQSKPVPNRFEFIHPNVKEIIKTYPSILLPNTCLSLNMSPCVSMQMNEVENYFKRHHRNIQEHTARALQALKSMSSSPVLTKDERNKTEKQELPKISHSEIKSTNSAISPINIKLQKPDKEEYQLVKEDGDLKIFSIKSDLKRKLYPRDNSSDVSSAPKKIKVLESVNGSEKKENMKPMLNKSSDQTPTLNNLKSKEEVPVQMSYVEKPLAVCNICNAVFTYAKELKRHLLKHLRCHFCKAKFKTIELKEENIEKQCVVKKTKYSYSLPDVCLVKIEFNLEIRRKYPKAFASFPPISGLNINPKKDKTKKSTNVTQKTKNSKKDGGEIIEIGSDDEELKNNSQNTTNNSQNTTKEQIGLLNNNSSLNVKASASTKKVLENLPPGPLQNLSSSVVKPDIRIKNSYVLDSIDVKATDTVILKELLRIHKKKPLCKDVAIQPDVLSNMPIKINLQDSKATLINLKNQLNLYRIPVDVKHGRFKVSYEYNQKKNTHKNMYLWGHMNPIDLKIPVKKIAVSKNQNTPSNQETNTAKKTNSTPKQQNGNRKQKTSYRSPKPRLIKPKSSTPQQQKHHSSTSQNHIITASHNSLPNQQVTSQSSNVFTSHEIFSVQNDNRLSQQTVNNQNLVSNQAVPNFVSTANTVNTAFSNIQQTSSSVSIQNGIAFTLSDNIVGNLGNMSTNGPVGNTVGISYQSSNPVLYPQPTSLSASPHLVYQNSQKPPIIMPPSNNYMSYNPNSSVYNTNTSMVVPNSVSQVLMASTPVLDNSSITSMPILPSPSNILPSPVMSSVSNIPPVTTNVSYSSPINHSDSMHSTIISSPSTNQVQTSNIPDCSNVSYDIIQPTNMGNMVPVNNFQTTDVVSDSMVQTTSMPYIKVKNSILICKHKLLNLNSS